jgi:hypothetical protein
VINLNPVEANLSLLVINKNQLGAMQKTRQNILSWFLLDSELRGEIENPGFYFNVTVASINRFGCVDANAGMAKIPLRKTF